MTKPTLTVHLPESPASQYPIYIGQNILAQVNTWLPSAFKTSKLVIITDSQVKKRYAKQLVRVLKAQHGQVLLLTFRSGEKSKHLKTKCRLENRMMRAKLGRDTVCLALGGGVVGDMAGFIAATYMRGIPYIQIPTTLLAMVDSSVGGKTGIDTPYGKNLLGAFWHPVAVVADTQCLSTLPPKHIINGLVEAAKMFLTHDAASFAYLQRCIPKILQGEGQSLTQIIKRAVAIKLQVVHEDPTEQNQRRVLNFGHTIGHALELVSGYKILHGYAVAYGILIEAKIAHLQGILSQSDYQRITDFFARLGFDQRFLRKFSAEKILKSTKLDKKVAQGEVYYVLLQTIGQVYQVEGRYAHPVTDSVVLEALQVVDA